MINKVISFIMVLLCSGSIALSQNLVIRPEFGLGTFYMGDLKDYQESLIPDLGVNVESLSKFPPFFGYGFSIVKYLKSGIGIGIISNLYSTGGRNYYEDYSGSYKMDLLTTSINFGTVLSRKNYAGEKMSLYFELQQGVKTSTLKENEEITVSTSENKDSFKFYSLSWWVKPELRLEYKLLKFLSTGIYIGAEINPGSSLHLKGNKNAYLVTAGQKKVTINWSGVRTGLYLSLSLPKIKIQKKELDQHLLPDNY